MEAFACYYEKDKSNLIVVVVIQFYWLQSRYTVQSSTYIPTDTMAKNILNFRMAMEFGDRVLLVMKLMYTQKIGDLLLH